MHHDAAGHDDATAAPLSDAGGPDGSTSAVGPDPSARPRGDAATNDPSTPPVARHALVAVDGSDGAARALAYAVALARAAHGRLTLLTVVPPPPWAQPGLVAGYDPAEIEREMAEALRAAAASVPPDVPVTTRLVHGHPVPEIIQRAEAGCHDVVVVGCEGHGPLGGAMAGVSHRVMRHARVPVIVVHAPPD